MDDRHVGDRDEPSRGGGDHSELLSVLDSHDIAFAEQPIAAADTTVFEVDEAADPAETFPQSVASGGPTPEGVIIWTRIAPEVFDADEPLGVQVAWDDGFADIVYEGVVDTAERIRAHDHTVKVDLDGHLKPDQSFQYRFTYRSVASRTGRCRTLPAPDASPESIRFAVLACQNYLNGYYPAFHHVAEEDVDFIVHVGDFIYESDEVLTVPFRIGSGPLSVYPVQGGWDGYTRERHTITEAIGATDVNNFVTLTGDMHSYITAYQQTSCPGRVTGGEGVAQGDRIGVEFMTPAVTSLNVAEALHLTRGWRKKLTEPLLSWLVPLMNPHIEYFDGHNWGIPSSSSPQMRAPTSATPSTRR